MTLSRWRRIATGIAAGIIVMCAAFVGASFRDNDAGVSVASEVRTPAAIPIPEDDEIAATETDDDEPAAQSEAEAPDDTTADAAASDDTAADESATDPASDTTTDESATGATDDTTTDESATDPGSDPVRVIEADALPNDEAAADAAESAATAEATETAGDDSNSESASAAPLTAADDALGTGGGVDDAECALDRLVIYAGARVGGVAGRIRAALTQAGFGAGCPAPVAVLASNCPLQFAGVLGADSGYDPNKSFVAASDSVDRETMTAIMGQVGYSGNQIDILDFSFVNADKPGEQWLAIFIPPSFTEWQTLVTRTGIPTNTQSLCAPSGQLAG